jgi:Protein of unknown function (DUF3151)
VPELPVNEPLETTIEEPDGSLSELASARWIEDLIAVVGRHPECLAGWASLGEATLEAGRPVEAYAYFRVGYHRGLDRIRGAGWRGRGRVPWNHEGNRGFLRSVKGLGRAAAAIGEEPEARRCEQFLAELAPDSPE